MLFPPIPIPITILHSLLIRNAVVHLITIPGWAFPKRVHVGIKSLDGILENALNSGVPPPVTGITIGRIVGTTAKGGMREPPGGRKRVKEGCFKRRKMGAGESEIGRLRR
ncbi:hypothetical protein GOBAR_AA08108 [Gossypium barbadense]|uniref:Uncharacterized protein n=1 Tax=Gossypium barbadense TaxID=3634 RepID=A0A2P5YAD6_GOSBA|nr:hypothetical protein GOBAR_AA08108 [Gossypium barbadense]